MLHERSEIEPVSGLMFQERICKPMKTVEVWQALMIKRYGAVAAKSQTLVRLNTQQKLYYHYHHYYYYDVPFPLFQ